MSTSSSMNESSSNSSFSKTSSSNRQADNKKEEEGKESVETNNNAVFICSGCFLPIKERYLLVAVDRKWHEDCLRCSCCNSRLAEIGSTLFIRSSSSSPSILKNADDKFLCKQDFLNSLASNTSCVSCKKTILSSELVMHVNNDVYHFECFKCEQCKCKLKVGDKFHMFANTNPEHSSIICIECVSGLELKLKYTSHYKHQDQEQQQKSKQIVIDKDSLDIINIQHQQKDKDKVEMTTWCADLRYSHQEKLEDAPIACYTEHNDETSSSSSSSLSLSSSSTEVSSNSSLLLLDLNNQAATCSKSKSTSRRDKSSLVSMLLDNSEPHFTKPVKRTKMSSSSLNGLNKSSNYDYRDIIKTKQPDSSPQMSTTTTTTTNVITSSKLRSHLSSSSGLVT